MATTRTAQDRQGGSLVDDTAETRQGGFQLGYGDNNFVHAFLLIKDLKNSGYERQKPCTELLVEGRGP